MGITTHSNEPLRWLKQAQHDWEVASMLLEKAPAATCFHCQEAVEKALKSAMIMVTGDTPHTNNIHELADKAQSIGLSIRREIRNLDVYYSQSRYPDATPGEKAPYEYFDQIEATESLTLSKQAIEQIRSFLVENKIVQESVLPLWNQSGI